MSDQDIQSAIHLLQDIAKHEHGLALGLQAVAPPGDPSPSILYLAESAKYLQKTIAFLDQLSEDHENQHKYQR